MIRQNINQDWVVVKGTVSMMDLFMGNSDFALQVDLPYDAMIHEVRSADTPNGNQTGFYPGGQYTYIKKLDISEYWEGKTITLEFEGVADTARVYINGDYAGGNLNPYTNFYIEASNYLNYGHTNELKVEVRSLEQSSRWYSGAGIYRNVNLLIGGPIHLKVDGLRITTPDVTADLAAVVIRTELVNRGVSNRKVVIQTEITDADGTIVANDTIPITAFAGGSFSASQRIGVATPKLWDDETPNLYNCIVKVLDGKEVLDEETTMFGIRSLQLSAQSGLRVNGKVVKLRGTCIHHDNGVIGAATFAAAEQRRCEQMKAAGFNCIRSSHHPISKAMLDACDRLGVYVIDELTDMWTRTKNPNDYANYFADYWKIDLQSMVDKDYNHPSVIFYSTGNEIPEAGSARGAEWNRRICNHFKELDDTRYTTNGVNGMLAGSARLGEIMCQATGMTTEQFESAAKQPANGNAGTGGADELNGMMDVMMGPIADSIATSPILYEMIDEFVASMDVAGYNYLTALHEVEKTRRPNRVVMGAETFPADIVHLWDLVKRNPHVIGDMTWTGYDYLGEAGCGIFHYDGAQNFSAHWPDRLAGIGDIDILGRRKPISYLREIVYGQRKNPYIGVLRMNRYGQKSSITPWMWKDNIASWTWPGFEGQNASVDVYADADEVELLLNGNTLGRQVTKGHYVATFVVPYQPGTLTAVSYTNGDETGRFVLETADEAVEVNVTVDKTTLAADGMDLAFIMVDLVDVQGRANILAQRQVTVTVEGSGTLQGFGSADPSCEGSYQDTNWVTYDGTVMAVVRSGKQPGLVTVTIAADGCTAKTLTMQNKMNPKR
jgi:beta-galactosidase